MIVCPSCGTRNRRGSKYCHSCGQRLDILFDVSCPACDRLNPGGSIFCAFCGARIPGPPPAERAAVAEQPAPVTEQPPEGGSLGAETTATVQPELPPWLYEQPEAAAAPSTVPSPSSTVPRTEQSKYLDDIPGVLPQTQGWLSSVHKSESKPVIPQVPPSRAKTRGGCLTLALLALLGVAGLALVSSL